MNIPCLLINNAFVAPGKAEVQLELSEKQMSSGSTSIIEFLSEGMVIQEAQLVKLSYKALRAKLCIGYHFRAFFDTWEA